MALVTDSFSDLQREVFLRQLDLSTDTAGAVVVVADQKVAATASVAITTSATQTGYLDKVIVGGLGATALGTAVLTVTNTIGSDITFPVPVPAGAAVGLAPLILDFKPPLRGAVGDDITVTLTSFGLGNLRADLIAFGHLA